MRLLRGYILPLAVPGTYRDDDRDEIFDLEWDPVNAFLALPGDIFAAGATMFFAIVASIFALAAIFALIAPMFGTARDYLAGSRSRPTAYFRPRLPARCWCLPAMAIVCMVGVCHMLSCTGWAWIGRLKGPAGGGAGSSESRSCRLFRVGARGAAGSAIGLL